jgi:hypothetical protein
MDSHFPINPKFLWRFPVKDMATSAFEFTKEIADGNIAFNHG